MTLYDDLGGRPVLEKIIDAFVTKMVSDIMIGFFFRNVDVKRLKQREFEFTARFLGADIPYTGRPMRTAHAPHPIMGGQFDRRRQILKECLEAHHVPEALQTEWLAHIDKLRPQITKDAAGVCEDPGVEPRMPFRLLE